MTNYRFDKYVFDSNSIELLSDGVRIGLRPKTGVLIALLLEHRHRLLSKQQLISQVWHTEYVQDQSLFQAISEIRKVFAPLQPIKTHPNLGYQWVMPVRVQPVRGWSWRLAGALSSIFAIALAVSWQVWKVSETSSVRTTGFQIVQSPAMHAYSTGLRHLNQQQLGDAWHFFDLAERENPLLLEAGVMKAEILFQQSDFPAARTQAQTVLSKAVVTGERYVEVAAQSLLSRVSEQIGQLDSALEWALEADHNARDQGFACVAENTRNRIADLLLKPDEQVDQVWLQPLQESEPLLASGAVTSGKYLDSSHCQQLHEWPDQTDIKPDLSQCKGIDIGYIGYAARDFPGDRKQQFSGRPLSKIA